MSEIERIRKMAAEGTITQEEADKLIALLQDIDQTEAQVDRVASEAAAASAPAVAAPPDMSRARTEPAGATQQAPVDFGGAAEAGGTRASRGAPEGLRWLRLPTLAGDFDIRVDETLDMPTVRGPEGLAVKEDADGWVLDFKQSGSFLDRLLSGNLGRDFDILLPENTGIDLQVKAGDVDMRGVPYLKGHILAGDVSARDLKGIDLTMSAGDLDVWLTPAEGRHRVAMTAGDLHIRLGKGSDVSVEGRVSIGDASVPNGFQSNRSGLGETFSGTVGGGVARLDITQSTGDARVSLDDA